MSPIQILKSLSDNLIVQVLATSKYSCLELIAVLPTELHKLLETKHSPTLKHRFIDPWRHELCLYGPQWEALVHSQSKIPLQTLKSLNVVEEFTEYEEKFIELRGLVAQTPHVPPSQLTAI